jgi:DNA-binding HxlR family transcriptional regulator
MKEPLKKLNKTFESRIRLGIMSILMVNDKVDFNGLKETLDITDGNLASHLKSLENARMITVSKEFVGRKPRTNYQATSNGRRDFEDHLKALEELIKNSK